MSLCSQLPEWRSLYDYWPPWRNSVDVTFQMRVCQLVYIIHLATETCDCVWKMNKRSILRDLLWHINLKHQMRFESQTHSQDDHVDRITDCSTRYGQAPAVCTRVRLAKGRWTSAATTRNGSSFGLNHATMPTADTTVIHIGNLSSNHKIHRQQN